MTLLKNSQSRIFLIQPLNKNYCKEIIAYADDEEQARTAAALLAKNAKHLVKAEYNTFSPETIYLSKGMSICIEAEPQHVNYHDDGIEVNYNGVLYELKNGQAKEVIAEHIL